MPYDIIDLGGEGANMPTKQGMQLNQIGKERGGRVVQTWLSNTTSEEMKLSKLVACGKNFDLTTKCTCQAGILTVVRYDC